MGFNGKRLEIDNVVDGRYSISSKGEIFDFKLNKIITGHLNTGYPRVTLMQKDNTQKSYYIHVLVAVMYLEDRRGELFVNHIDGDKVNCDVSNLEWISHRENMQHAMLTGLLNRKPLFEKDVIKICEMRQSGKSAKEISEELDILLKTVEGITNGYNWKDISSRYKFPERTITKRSILNEENVRNICELRQKGDSVKDISLKLNIHPSTIEGVVNGYRWKYISVEYNFPVKNPGKRLSIDTVKHICTLISKDYTLREISNMLEIPYATIGSIRQKVSHKAISDNYF